MTAGGKPPPTHEELQSLNRALDAQLRQLVKVEQRLYLTQRDRARQLARLDALNRFALEATELEEPRDVMVRAAGILFAVFPFDQFLGFLGDGSGAIRCAVVQTVDGREPNGKPLESLSCVDIGWHHPEGSRIGTAEQLRAVSSGVIECFDALFEAPEHQAPMLVIPLTYKGEKPLGLLAFRRVDRAISFHEELPTAKDMSFFGVVSQQVAATVANAQLVRDLKLSYQELARAQASLVDRERLAAVGEFAAVVAHEVRNPLGVIFNVLAMLRKLLHEGEAVSLVDILREESERLNQIVSDLIDFARPHPPTLTRASLHRVIESAVESVRATFPGRPIELVTVSNLPDVMIDTRLMRQALVNLLVNAVQASPEGSPVVARVAIEAGEVHIEIADHGAGIPQPLVGRIFEPFFTTKAAGTGLGLSVVKRVVEAHHGTIALVSVPGEGSTFTVRLPKGD